MLLAITTLGFCATGAQVQIYNFITITGLAGTTGSADGTNSTVRFNHPDNVVVDTSVGTNWVSSTIAGFAETPGSADGTNSTIRFSTPSALAVDRAGNVYVADRANHTIRKLTPVGTNWVSSTIAGQAGKFGSVDGTNLPIQFNAPTGMAMDNAGNLYVADTGNFTIRELTPIGTNWVSSTVGGMAGQSASVNGTNSAARFSFPVAVMVDSSGNIYVADEGDNTVRKGVLLSIAPPPPVFQALNHTNGKLVFTWSARAGQSYQLQYSSSLDPANWLNLGNIITATNGTVSTADTLGAEAQRFFRIAQLP